MCKGQRSQERCKRKRVLNEIGLPIVGTLFQWKEIQSFHILTNQWKGHDINEPSKQSSYWELKEPGKVLGYDISYHIAIYGYMGGWTHILTNGYIALMLLKIQTISTYTNIICCWGRVSMEQIFHETQSFTLTPARPSLVPRSNFLTHYTQGWAYFRICFV